MRRILIQAGHVEPREPGHEGQTGTRREQEFALLMQEALRRRFTGDGRFGVTLCPGDIPDGWTGDVFLALHLDGSASSSSHGFSLGWPANGRNPGQGPLLAARITKGFLAIPHPGGHHIDNYTDGLRGYYGWSRVNAAAKVLIEHGFSTNPTEQAWMFSHVAEMADATYRAVLEHLGFAYPAAKPGGPPWVATVDNREIGRGSLLNPLFVARISAALRAAGGAPPWTARVTGIGTIATGKFWPAGEFTRRVSAQLRAGRDVHVNGLVTLRPH